MRSLRPLVFIALAAALIGLGSSASLRHPAVALGSGSPATKADFTGDTIYQIITDRFYDGNTSNNNPASSPNLYSADKSNWTLYWGGDWAGITQKMSYLQGLGVTAIWISPAVQNVNVPVPINGVNQAGYHGYWGMDFYVPEPHFGSWTEFDNMVSTAHADGIKVVLDWAPNHSNPADPNNSSYAKNGSIYNNGSFVASYSNDPNGCFHKNGSISDYSDLYSVWYKSIVNLADFAGENSCANSYLRGAVDTWLSHGVDGIRMDAVKLMPTGQVKAYDDHILNKKSVFIFGEWFDSNGATLWPEEIKFANTAGQSLQNIDLNTAIRDVFMNNANMSELDTTVSRDASDFTYQNQLVNSVDTQDIPRFLSVNNNQTLLNEAYVFDLTTRGIPCIYYGDEQYLHNDTNGGSDPYNRPMMSSFSTTTTLYQIIQKLSALRQSNPAIRYGSSTQRWINNDVYIYERQVNGDEVLVALNKSTTTGYNITGLNTALPAGTYSDQLNGLAGGGSITVTNGTFNNNPVNAFTLGAGQAAVWSFVESAPSTPQVGNVDPVMGRNGDVVAVTGRGFGTSTGTVTVGGTSATVNYWSDGEVDFTVPSGAPTGTQQVVVTKSGGGASNGISYNVLSGPQVPVTFTVNNANTSFGDNVYLTGNNAELCNWCTTTSGAVGRFVDPNYPTWFDVASLPASSTVQYKYIIIHSDGTVTWDGGNNHQISTPADGSTGSFTDNW
ncbi:MAG TPA: alpha-amylase family glycosyl hydrolase [Gaiellaceae bacterium]|nr:alpha-amylase family glycosyl hydrolase [Gaiellaceae bacterium]